MKRYFIYNLVKADCVIYVGCTIDVDRRLIEHKVTHGKDISINILDEYFGEEDTAIALETFWIKKYRDLGYVLKNVKQKQERRVGRTYKCTEEAYFKASKRAEEEGTTLSALIEQWVTKYARGVYCENFQQ